METRRARLVRTYLPATQLVLGDSISCQHRFEVLPSEASTVRPRWHLKRRVGIFLVQVGGTSHRGPSGGRRTFDYHPYYSSTVVWPTLVPKDLAQGPNRTNPLSIQTMGSKSTSTAPFRPPRRRNWETHFTSRHEGIKLKLSRGGSSRLCFRKYHAHIFAYTRRAISWRPS